MDSLPAQPNGRFPGPGAPASGSGAFTGLDARQEPWLVNCYVPPTNFSEISGDRAVVVFGEPGMGKTALYQMLQRACCSDRERPARLAVPWKPAPILPGENPDAQWARQLSAQIAEACGLALARLLATYPQAYQAVPGWARTVVTWYLRQAITGPLPIRLGQIFQQSGPEGKKVIQALIDGDAPDILYDPTPEQMIEQLIQVAPFLGLEAIWILTDDVDPLADFAGNALKDSLNTLFSTLTLFEHLGLTYKLILPARLSVALSQTACVRRRRIDPYFLQWTDEQLARMVETRLALALNCPGMKLDDLCEPAAGLKNWLARVGGSSPREWLDQVQPLVHYYEQNHLAQPVSLESWQELRAEHPPRFYMTEDGRSVQVGGREVPLEGVPPKAFEILRYLYEHANTIVGKDELYFHIYLGLDTIPRTSADRNYVPPKDYTGLIDTSIYRLRKAVEPDPECPVLLQTVRGYGVRLVSRW